MAHDADRAEVLTRLTAELRMQALRSVMLHSAVAARLGITVTDFNCLNVLSLEGPQTAGRLAERTGLTRGGAVTAMIDRLEAAGYVRRRRDPADRRRVLVELEESATARIAPLFAEFGASVDEYLDGYPTDQLRLLLHAVADLNDRVAAATARLAGNESARPRRTRRAGAGGSDGSG
ncbi:MarR family transcriptional regulator [uncultured Mycolicibacterium sp.]|uniref:MarR family winged helix-turn-helix transcriptional regulator n=1 Tax=uncultured Mycolicibacterium sp. TaxID=2320817 RepID=UPI0026258B31|nr:MarR family transcriptional regulator [uncultured Mycolicibacterium sp.]